MKESSSIEFCCSHSPRGVDDVFRLYSESRYFKVKVLLGLHLTGGDIIGFRIISVLIYSVYPNYLLHLPSFYRNILSDCIFLFLLRLLGRHLFSSSLLSTEYKGPYCGRLHCLVSLSHHSLL